MFVRPLLKQVVKVVLTTGALGFEALVVRAALLISLGFDLQHSYRSLKYGLFKS